MRFLNYVNNSNVNHCLINMKGVLNMRMKKGIITIATIAVVVLGVFFAVRLIGGENTANVKTPEDNIVQSDNSITKDNNEEVTSDNEESNLNTSEVQEEIENAQGQNANEMDTAYINDKTNVGTYIVKKDDTVFNIAKTYMPSHDKNEIVEFIKIRNGLDKDFNIEIGQSIVIPYEKAIETATTVGSEANAIEYTIKKQDTLTSIAKNNMPSYNVKHAIEMLKETNKITNENAIKEGTIIYIPK